MRRGGHGKRPPSMRTVERFAQAVCGHVVLRIEPAQTMA